MNVTGWSFRPGKDRFQIELTIFADGALRQPARKRLETTKHGGCAMYDVSLTESCFPAIVREPPEKNSLGDLLRRQAREHADRVAIREVGYDGEIGRIWTYKALLGV